jgi:hypothetical protein
MLSSVRKLRFDYWIYQIKVITVYSKGKSLTQKVQRLRENTFEMVNIKNLLKEFYPKSRILNI